MSCSIIEKVKNLFSYLWHAVCGNDSNIRNRIDKLEELVHELTRFCDQKESEPPIVVEQLYVERINIDKVEYNNNFGSLGIKELSGMLNIGANYGLGSHKRTEQKQQPDNKTSEDKDKKKNTRGQGPKCKMNYKETKQTG